MTDFVLATANQDKAREIADILGPSVRLFRRPDWVGEVDETGETLLDNARLKARAVAEATNRPAIADDTGLEVDDLGGQPGVRSARFAGERATYSDNVAKLMSSMDRVARRAPGSLPHRGRSRLARRQRGSGGRRRRWRHRQGAQGRLRVRL